MKPVINRACNSWTKHLCYRWSTLYVAYYLCWIICM